MLNRLGDTTCACIRHPQEFHLCARSPGGRHLAQSGQGVEVMGLGNRQAEGEEVNFTRASKTAHIVLNRDAQAAGISCSTERHGACESGYVWCMYVLYQHVYRRCCFIECTTKCITNSAFRSRGLRAS